MPAEIKHIVVLMFENRSYDNVLGWLYGSGNAAPYDTPPPGQTSLNGLTGSESNVDPYSNQPVTVANAKPNSIGSQSSGQIYPATAIPVIDPHETFGNMAQQYLGVPPDTTTPWNNYASGSAPMSGYMANYQSADGMTPVNIADVMTYLTPAQLPVSAYLANQFGVADQWYASVPTQTFTNRLFAFCASPQVVNPLFGDQYCVVDDADHPFHPLALLPDSSVVDLPSILSKLGDANWKLYFHDYSIAILTIPYIANAAQSGQANVSTFDSSDWGSRQPLQMSGPAASTFVEDVQNGTLPPFSFIEPRYAGDLWDWPGDGPNDLPPNSNHPGPGNYGIGVKVEPKDPPIDATGGELLLMQVYNLLRNSSYWDSTLLIVTYDEAGGVYDHAAPPTAVSPTTLPVKSPRQHDTAAEGFEFNAYGGRVPAIIVSPYIGAGTQVTPDEGVFDHSSIVRTAWTILNVGEGSLTPRDAGAPSLAASVNLSLSNDAPPFSGTIVPSPSQIIIVSDRLFPKSRILLASAGPGIALTATGASIETWKDEGQNWLTVTPISDIAFAPDVYGWTIGIDTSALGDFGDANLTGAVTVAANENTPAVTVGVFLELS